MLLKPSLSLLALAAGAVANPVARANASAPVNQTTCNGKTYVYEELAGYGFLASTARDKYGDTIGGIGSAIALDKSTWKKVNGKSNAYSGILWGLPDRGWNTEGTQNTQSRIHKFSVTLTIVSNATVANPASPNINIQYLDTILLTDPNGTPTTGLDADASGHASFKGFPDLPVATYTGDGFGGNGTGGRRVSLDTEGLFLGAGGSFWISDEYGPYVYQFDKNGKMIDAIRPPDAYIPIRNGSESFNADSPPIYDADRETTPEDPVTGRQNNQGFEGLTVSPDGKQLYVLLQSALEQEGGTKKKYRRNTRFLHYDISGKDAKVVGEYVVPLPLDSAGNIDAQSEIHYISDTQFLILARDSGNGHGQDSSTSIYRNADVFDISNATNVKGQTYDSFNGSIASTTGVLKTGVTAALYCPWLSYNNNDQLNRFGVHNGGAQDSTLLNEKWESLALLPVSDSHSYGSSDENEYFLFSFSDNDFITQNGYINFGKDTYKDSSGYSLDNQALVFRVKLPAGANPS